MRLSSYVSISIKKLHTIVCHTDNIILRCVILSSFLYSSSLFLFFIQLTSSSSSSDVIALFCEESPFEMLLLSISTPPIDIAVASDISSAFLEDNFLRPFTPGGPSGLTLLRGAPWAVTRCFLRYHLFLTTLLQRLQVTPCDWIWTLTMCCFRLKELEKVFQQ